MSKLSLETTYVFFEHCNWDVYTPYSRSYITTTPLVRYNVVNTPDNVVYGAVNVVHFA